MTDKKYNRIEEFERMQSMMPSAVDFARDILYMQQEIESLRYENEHLKKIRDDYFKFLAEQKKNHEQFMGDALSACLTTTERSSNTDD